MNKCAVYAILLGLMTLSVCHHPRSFQVSGYDGLVMAISGFSALPFAKRHWELSQVESKWSHRLIALIECIPVIGLGMALAERMIVWVIGSGASLPWRDAPVGKPEAWNKMIANQHRAIEERSMEGRAYVSGQNLCREELLKEEVSPISLTHTFAEAQGVRPTMEDAHFFEKLEGGTLMGVFDGHLGDQVSRYASKEFPKRFARALQGADGNVYAAYERAIHQIQQDIASWSPWNRVGSTAVVCYVDDKTHQIFTATIGDSEANIYRKTFWGMKSIPLSCVRGWSPIRTLEDLEAKMGRVQARAYLAKGNNWKNIRTFVAPDANIPRGFGDVYQAGVPAAMRVLHKPKITVNKLQAGDQLVIACDGLKDFVPEREVVRVLSWRKSTWSMLFGSPQKTGAELLVDKAFECNTTDNVSVLHVDVHVQ